MKRTWKILTLCLILLAVMSLLVACGDDPGSTPGTDLGNTPGNSTGGGDGDDESTLVIKTGEIDLLSGDFDMDTLADGTTVFSVTYDGEPHMLNADNYEGVTDPERTTLTFEYYLNGTKIAAYDDDGNQTFGDAKYANGITEAGTYEARLVFKAKGYRDGIKSARFVIASSYNVSYVVGQPTGDGVPAMVCPSTNPAQFSTKDTDLALADPTMSSENLGYNFRGWYTDAACTEANKITVIDGSQISESLLASGTLTLYAKFEACVAYPPIFIDSTSTTDGRVTTAPTLPAIPGYEDMAPDAFKLVDMSQIDASGNNAYGYNYSTHADSNKAPYDPNNKSVYGLDREPSVQTAGGQYAIQWQDPADTWDGPIVGSKNEQVHTPGDGNFGAMMILSSLPRYNYGMYDTLEFWIYNANNVGNVITLLAFINENDKTSMYLDLELNFSGWKKFIIHISDFGTSAASSTNITKLHFYGMNLEGGSHSENATLSLDKEANFVYFSDIFLTNNSTPYSSSSAKGFIPDPKAIPQFLNNISAMTVNATLTDAEVADILANNLAESGDSYFNDIVPTDSASIMEVYERIMYLSESWNDPDSTYYHNADLLEVIADGLNYMTPIASDLVNQKVEVDEYYEAAAYYIVKTYNNIASYTNTRHAETWMAPVLYFVNAPVGSGDRMVRTAYTFACASLAIGNPRGFQTGMRSIMAALNNNRITLAMNSADLVDALALFSATKGTAFMVGNTDSYISTIFDWFFYSIDSLLVNGQVKSDIAALDGFVDLDTYIRAMLTVYSLGNTEDQNRFAAAVKYYMANNEDLQTTIANNAYYTAEATALAAVMANTATAADYVNESKLIRTFENIGQVFIKNGEDITLIDRVGTVIGASIDALNCDKIYTAVVGDIVTIVTGTNSGDSVIFLADGNVDVQYFGSEDPYVAYSYNGSNVVVSADRNAVVDGAEGNGTISATNGAPVIAGTTVVDGKLNVSIYNYQHFTTNITITLLGSYKKTVDDNLYSISDANGKTTIKVNLLTETTVRVSTESVFVVVLEPKA